MEENNNTDMEILIDAFNRIGVSAFVKVDGVGGASVILEAGHGNVKGYDDFFAEFEFDRDGKHKKCGIWE